MGTRLYPQTDDPRILEKLAGATTGTYEKLKIIKDAQYAYEKNPPSDLHPDVIGYAFFTLMNETEFDRLDNFLEFGYGKFDYSLLGRYSPGGGTSDPALVEKLLRSSTNFDPNIHDVPDILEMVDDFRWH